MNWEPYKLPEEEKRKVGKECGTASVFQMEEGEGFAVCVNGRWALIGSRDLEVAKKKAIWELRFNCTQKVYKLKDQLKVQEDMIRHLDGVIPKTDNP